MSLGGGMPRLPGGGGARMPRMPRTPRMPRIRDPRTVARSQLSRNPLVRGWRQLRSNRLIRMFSGKGKGGAQASGSRSDTSMAPDSFVGGNGFIFRSCPQWLM